MTLCSCCCQFSGIPISDHDDPHSMQMNSVRFIEGWARRNFTPLSQRPCFRASHVESSSSGMAVAWQRGQGGMSTMITRAVMVASP